MLYAKHERPDSSTPLFDIATDEEIKAAHPKCGTCTSNNSEEFGLPWCYVRDHAVDPDNDYCSDWEAK